MYFASLFNRSILFLNINTFFSKYFSVYSALRFKFVRKLIKKICSYHPSEAALTAFYEDALCVTKQFLVNASSLKERIGALYLTYGVYYKMPIKHLKIRMTLSDWRCLMELHSQIKEEEYLDANYILCKLIVERAFIHCISDREVYVKPLLLFTLNIFLFQFFVLYLFFFYNYAFCFIGIHLIVYIFKNFL